MCEADSQEEAPTVQTDASESQASILLVFPTLIGTKQAVRTGSTVPGCLSGMFGLIFQRLSIISSHSPKAA